MSSQTPIYTLIIFPDEEDMSMDQMEHWLVLSERLDGPTKQALELLNGKFVYDRDASQKALEKRRIAHQQVQDALHTLQKQGAATFSKSSQITFPGLLSRVFMLGFS